LVAVLVGIGKSTFICPVAGINVDIVSGNCAGECEWMEDKKKK